MAKATEFGARHKRMKNLAELDSMQTELAQGRKKLGNERVKIAQLENEHEEIRLAHNVNNERQFRAEENQRRAEKERKDMEEHLAKAMENQTWAENDW